MRSILQRIQRGLSTVELVHTPHPRWPLPPGPHIPQTLQISVLDSSFNPPTLAHLALANTPPATSPDAPTLHVADFDARLLLLSVRNADKQLKQGDATYEQRMEMMVLLAHDLASPSSPSSTPHIPNVAVAIIDEPTFVGKSALLLDFLQKRISDLLPAPPVVPQSPQPPPPTPAPKLTFLMGTDTIVRFFAPRYYASEPAMLTALRQFLSPSENGNGSRIICARRSGKDLPRAEEEELPEFVREIAPPGSIAFADIGQEEATYSSSEVRERIAARDDGWRRMVTGSIAAFISQHDLYSAPSS